MLRKWIIASLLTLGLISLNTSASADASASTASDSTNAPEPSYGSVYVGVGAGIGMDEFLGMEEGIEDPVAGISVAWRSPNGFWFEAIKSAIGENADDATQYKAGFQVATMNKGDIAIYAGLQLLDGISHAEVDTTIQAVTRVDGPWQVPTLIEDNGRGYGMWAFGMFEVKEGRFIRVCLDLDRGKGDRWGIMPSVGFFIAE